MQGCVQAFWYMESDLIFNLSNPRATILQGKNQFQVVRYNKSYTVFFLLTDMNLWLSGENELQSFLAEL